MKDLREQSDSTPRRLPKLALAAIVCAYLVSSLWGLGWGLYTPQRESYLFPASSGWSRMRVADIQANTVTQHPTLGSDVDPNPSSEEEQVVILNRTDSNIAEIFSRYLLYSAQPDEMITFRAIGRMDPQRWDFDPGLYQYGGLFIYPIAALIKVATVCGCVKPGSLHDYLMRPEAFSHFYWIARGYVVFWGLIGVCVVYALGRRLCDWRAGSLAALLFAVMPVVVSASHEAKPHLPGAVLMLWAVLAAQRYNEKNRWGDLVFLSVLCGAACGMVVSSVWIVLLVPLAAWLAPRIRGRQIVYHTLVGLCVVATVYSLLNPYVLINVITQDEALLSNLANSTQMYHFGRLGEGFVTAGTLLLLGSSPVVVFGGLVLLLALAIRDWRKLLLLTLPALVVFVQLVLLAAGKPPEYARFAIFPIGIICVVLAVGVFRLVAVRWYHSLAYSLIFATCAVWPTLRYWSDFHRAASPRNLRNELADFFSEHTEQQTVGVLRAPAPYNFPPIDFSKHRVVQLPKDVNQWPTERPGWPEWLIVPQNGIEGVDLRAILEDGYYTPIDSDLPADSSPISWAEKPLVLLHSKLNI